MPAARKRQLHRKRPGATLIARPLMQVKVLLFGQLREVVGASEEEVDLSEGACVADLFDHYQQRFPRMKEFCPSIAMAVNQEYAESSVPLRAGDEVALLPPVSGGASESPAEWVMLTHEPIKAAELAGKVIAPKDGAVVTFDGIVRNHTGGRQTLYIDYEAYQPMALAKMREIAAAIREEFSVDGIVLVHRLGRVEIGETSVFIAVSSPHRAPAFVACRNAIDTLKQSAPIWKKEYFVDGEGWAEGELPGPAMESKPAKEEA